MGFGVVSSVIPRFGLKQVGVFRVMDELFPEGYLETPQGKALLKAIEGYQDSFTPQDKVVINIGMTKSDGVQNSRRLTALVRIGQKFEEKFIEAQGWLQKAAHKALKRGSIIDQAVHSAREYLQGQQTQSAIAQRWF